MLRCRACGAEIGAGALACRACGRPVAAGRRARPRLGCAVLVGVLLGLAVVAVYWWLEIRPRVARILDPWIDAEPVEAVAQVGPVDPGALFDVAVELPGNPLNAVWTGERFVLGNRVDPWGLMLVERGPRERWRVSKQPVLEPTYHQRMSLDALAWNGRELVAVADGAWFGREGQVFVTLDPVSYRIGRVRTAPDQLGCLVWDGRGYWGATRRNTADEARPAHLYRFDARLAELERHDSPGVGCQGLAWDGRRLWFADVFDDSLTVLDLATGAPRWSGGDRLEIEYLSGVAWDGESIWIAEYDGNRLRRLNPILQRAWSGARARAEAEP